MLRFISDTTWIINPEDMYNSFNSTVLPKIDSSNCYYYIIAASSSTYDTTYYKDQDSNTPSKEVAKKPREIKLRKIKID